MEGGNKPKAKSVRSHLGVSCLHGFTLFFVLICEFKGVQVAENRPAFMLHLKPNPMKSRPV